MELDHFGGKIVPFSEVRKDMGFPAISEVRAYWEALRNGRKVPLRSEIDPRGIERALEYAFILERIAPNVSRFRLAGMHLNDLMGMEVRGMPITSFFTPAARPEASEIIEKVFRAPQIAELALSAESGFGKPPMQAKLIILPLQSDLGDISRALGCLVAEGAVGRAPRRFDLASVALTPIEAGKATFKPVPAPARGFAECLAPMGGAPKSDRSHLRLVKTDK